MKNLIVLVLLAPLFLLSCGKTEEMKTVVNPPLVEKQIVVTPPIVESPVVAKGSVVESGTGKIEEVSTGVIYTKDLWKWFLITQTEKITTLSYSGNEIFSKINNQDNQIVGGGVDVLCGTGVLTDSLKLTKEELAWCELAQNRIYFAVDMENTYQNKFFIIRKNSYNPWRNSYLFDSVSNKKYQIASKNVLQLDKWEKWYYLLTWIDKFDGENQLSFLSSEGELIDQINDFELAASINKFDILKNWDIQIYYGSDNQTKIIPLKLK